MTFRLREADLGDADLGAMTAIVNESGNDADSLPMRAVNARLGYQPPPDFLVLRGPLFAGMMAR